jgi:FkbM family methyltransferase
MLSCLAVLGAAEARWHGGGSVDRQADDACEMAIRVNDRPSLEKEARFLTGVDKNCSCPKGVFVDVVIGDSLSAVKAKVCHLPMPMQKLPTLRILSPLQDMAAYPAMEVDRHMHGRLSHALGHGGKRWLDVGANLGVLSISLALANPNATGVALEPNPTAFGFLQRNIAAYGLSGRITAINAGLSRDGAGLLQMPRCVVTAPGGSQMASTQWGGSPAVSENSCFSSACKKRAAAVRQCMVRPPPSTPPPPNALASLSTALATALARHHRPRTTHCHAPTPLRPRTAKHARSTPNPTTQANDPRMVSIRSLSLSAAMALAVPPPAEAARAESDLASLALGSGQHLSAAKAAPPGLALLKVDCQGWTLSETSCGRGATSAEERASILVCSSTPF